MASGLPPKVEPWLFGTNTDIGTLVDSRTGAKIDREAGGVRIGYGFESVQFSSAVEYRVDKTRQPDQALAERTTWLYRNSFKYQLTPDWRLLGKFNHADSTSSLGQFYDGGYTEAVVGYGYRPVDHDRLNALAKYTYFYNVPTTEQVTPQYVAAQFIQKSHIGALDVTYYITDRWSVGGRSNAIPSACSRATQVSRSALSRQTIASPGCAPSST